MYPPTHKNPQRTFWSCLPIAMLLITLSSVAAADQKPNVLLLVADDMRPDAIHAFGHPDIETPNLDKLAREGTVLTNATCAYPLCFPSRAEILSGYSAFRTGVGIRQTALAPGEKLWPHVMQTAGYRTVHVGKWHVAGKPTERGYDRSVALFASGKRPDQPQFDFAGRPVTGYVGWQFQSDDGQRYPERGVGLTPDISEAFADAAIQVIQESDSRPFFLHVNFTAPHDPRLFPSGYEKKYSPEKLSLPKNFAAAHPFDHGNLKGRDEVLLAMPRTEQEVRAELAAYYAVISHLDEEIGRILAALEESKQADNTIVIFTSDHGLAVGSHGLTGKQNMYEHSIRVPLLVRGPNIRPGIRTPALCYLRDLYPTVCNLCGIEVADEIDGRSLGPVLRGKTDSAHPFVIGYFQNVQRMIRTDRWKLIWYPKISREQLFDIENDPDELHDLAADPTMASVREDLRRQLRAWLADRQDPALSE